MDHLPRGQGWGGAIVTDKRSLGDLFHLSSTSLKKGDKHHTVISVRIGNLSTLHMAPSSCPRRLAETPGWVDGVALALAAVTTGDDVPVFLLCSGSVSMTLVERNMRDLWTNRTFSCISWNYDNKDDTDARRVPETADTDSH